VRTRERLIHQYVQERFAADDVAVRHYDTLRTVWLEWFGPGGARQTVCPLRCCGRVLGGLELMAMRGLLGPVVLRPGQVVALDTTVLLVLVRDGLFGDPVSAHLSIALDVYTHALVGFRLALVSDTGLDIAMLLRDVMTPTRMRGPSASELLTDATLTRGPRPRRGAAAGRVGRRVG
jgi:hypothetical protein